MKVMGRSRSFFRICLIIWTIGSRISAVWLSNRRGIRKYRKKQEIQNGTKRKIYCRVRSLTNAEKRHALWIRPVFGFSCQRRLCSSILRGDLSDILAFFFDCLPLFWPLTPYPCSIAMHLTLLVVSSHFLHSLTSSSSLNPLTSYPPPTCDHLGGSTFSGNLVGTAEEGPRTRLESQHEVKAARGARRTLRHPTQVQEHVMGIPESRLIQNGDEH